MTRVGSYSDLRNLAWSRLVLLDTNWNVQTIERDVGLFISIIQSSSLMYCAVATVSARYRVVLLFTVFRNVLFLSVIWLVLEHVSVWPVSYALKWRDISLTEKYLFYTIVCCYCYYCCYWSTVFALLLSAMQQECSLVAFYLVGRSVGVTGTETE